MPWPTFIVIGAPRSGTTSLHSYLAQHPDVYMSAVKEPNFFLFGGSPPDFGGPGPGADMTARDSVYREEDYLALFEPGAEAIARGESSPKYLPTPGTARRIYERIPRVRIVAILRDPVDRALSDFALRVRDGWEPCDSLEEALAEEDRRIRENWALGLYLQRGFYARHLKEYYAHFPEEQIRVFLYDDLRDRPRWLLESLFRFVGVDPAFEPDTSRSLNVSGRIRNPLLRFVWTRTNWAKDLLRPVLGKRLRKRLSRFFITQPKRGLEFPDDLKRTLRSKYAEDVRALQELIERDLSSWMTNPDDG